MSVDHYCQSSYRFKVSGTGFGNEGIMEFGNSVGLGMSLRRWKWEEEGS